MPTSAPTPVFGDGDLFAMSILPWGLSPRSAISLRQHADDSGMRSSTHWWLMHTLFLFALIVAMVICLGIFEYVRFGTFILEATCVVQDHEIVELGACSTCKGTSCSLFPKAMATLMVTFQPVHANHNVTGVVSYCKNQQIRGCISSNIGPSRYPINMVGPFRWQDWLQTSGIPWEETEGEDGRQCDLMKVYKYAKDIRAQPVRKCYYNSRDPGGRQVWFSEVNPVQRGTLLVMNHQGIPLLCLFCGVLLSLASLLGCFSLVD